MNKYIDALIAKIAELRKELPDSIEHLNDEERGFARGQQYELTAIEEEILHIQQEQQKDKQVVVITESHGNANIEWDCRSLDDVMALLKSAESFISDKQVEKLRGLGCGSDYDTVEGRYSKLLRYQQKQPECSSSLIDVDAVREDFIAEVYRVLNADSTNDRANAIIDAFDSLPTVSQEQPKVDLEKAVLRVYESWMGGTMDDIRRDMVELGRVINARKV